MIHPLSTNYHVVLLLQEAAGDEFEFEAQIMFYSQDWSNKATGGTRSSNRASPVMSPLLESRGSLHDSSRREYDESEEIFH